MPISHVIITSLGDGDVELLDRVPTEAESGWDSMRDTYLIRQTSAGRDPHLVTIFPRGSQISGKNMWVVSRSGRCRAEGIFVFEVVSMGLLSPRGDRVRYSAGANAAAGQNIFVPDFGVIAGKLETVESQAAVDIEYIIIGDQPAVEDAGAAHTPPSPWEPTVKPSIWASLVDPTWHYPDGWILAACDAENLPGLDDVWLVRDRYSYTYRLSP